MSILGRINLGKSTMYAVWIVCIAWLVGTGWLACAIEHVARRLPP